MELITCIIPTYKKEVWKVLPGKSHHHSYVPDPSLPPQARWVGSHRALRSTGPWVGAPLHQHPPRRCGPASTAPLWTSQAQSSARCAACRGVKPHPCPGPLPCFPNPSTHPLPLSTNDFALGLDTANSCVIGCLLLAPGPPVHPISDCYGVDKRKTMAFVYTKSNDLTNNDCALISLTRSLPWPLTVIGWDMFSWKHFGNKASSLFLPMVPHVPPWPGSNKCCCASGQQQRKDSIILSYISLTPTSAPFSSRDLFWKVCVNNIHYLRKVWFLFI